MTTAPEPAADTVRITSESNCSVADDGSAREWRNWGPWLSDSKERASGLTNGERSQRARRVPRQSPTLRSTVLRHALLPHLLGAVVLATAVNLVAGLSGR